MLYSSPSKAGSVTSTGTEEKPKGGQGMATGKDKKEEAATARTAEVKRRTLTKRRLATDAFDLFLPGAITGWIPVSSETVGFAGVVSTTLGLMEIWNIFFEAA